jgi:virulence-associated protein VapD
MNYNGYAIGSYFNSLLIDPGQSSDYTVKVRFYFKTHDGTVYINQSHDINSISGTATLMSGTNGNQHYAKIILEEVR